VILAEYRKLVDSLHCGKRLPDAVYIHSTLLPELSASLKLQVEKLSSRMLLSE